MIEERREDMLGTGSTFCWVGLLSRSGSPVEVDSNKATGGTWLLVRPGMSDEVDEGDKLDSGTDEPELPLDEGRGVDEFANNAAEGKIQMKAQGREPRTHTGNTKLLISRR